MTQSLTMQESPMQISLPCRTAFGPVGVIRAAFAAIMLTALAQPVAADPLSASGNGPYEGHDLQVTFTNARTANHHIRYKFKTADGSATGSGRWQDYEPASGYVQWSPHQSNAQAPATVKTFEDSLCEYDETVKIILTDPQFSTWIPSGWFSFCPNPRGFPCRFEAEVTIKQHADGCAARPLGE